MDFDTAKENIQPLRGGRRADRLETALGAEKDILEQERKEYEEAIENYTGNDPLDNWYAYISWIEQSYPKSGNESGLHEAVSKCILKFENDMRYRQDRRLIKLFIKYIDTQDNPHELYEQLYNSGIGTIVSDLYIAWSYYYDAANDFKKAEAIFQKGFNAGAQPYDELAQAHQIFSISVTQRMLYDDDSSKKKFQETMDEKRNALTSLRVYNKKYVGSLRVGNAIKSENPGRVLPVNENFEQNAQQQRKVSVLQDEGLAADGLIPGSSGIKSIFEISKKIENAHEAGPWNKASKSSKNKLFDSKAIGSSTPGFCIMEDESLPPIPCNNKLYEEGTKLPPNWVSKNQPQKPWNIPVVVEEPTAPNSIPCYDKFMLYPSPEIEISLEEWRGYRWFKSHGISCRLVEQHESVFENKYRHGARIIPGFAKKNIKQDDVKYPLEYDVNNNSFQFPIKKMISADGQTEYSNEELLAEKFKRGGIKLVSNDDFEETDDDMDITVIGERRESVYCLPRKSIVPRKSILRKSVMPPVNEDEKQEPTVKFSENNHRVRFEDPITEEEEPAEEKRTLMKRKLEIEPQASRPKSLSPEPKRLSADEDYFKAPPPPKSTTAKSLFSDENDETFSTQKFNFFINQKAISTPISKKTASRVASGNNDPSPEQQKSEVNETAESTLQQNINAKLSTIAEVTETSSSTKSSVSQFSSENEVDSHVKSKTPCKVGKKWDDCSQNPINMFRMPEEQTETTPFIMASMLPKLKDLQQPSFKIFEEPLTINDSIKVPMPNVSLQIPHPDDSIKVREDEPKILEVPELSETIQNVDKSVMFVPTPEIQPEDEEIPATQDIYHEEIPATQDVTLTKGDEFNVPSMSDSTLKQLKDFDLIPATQELSIKNVSGSKLGKLEVTSNEQSIGNISGSKLGKMEEFSIRNISGSKLETSVKNSASPKTPIEIFHDSQVLEPQVNNTKVMEVPQMKIDDVLEVPEIQNLTIHDDHVEIPATQEFSIKELDHVEIPATQEMSIAQPDLIPESSSKLAPTNKMPFSVYEDSVCVVPEIQNKPPASAANQSSIMSKKENFVIAEPNSIKRTSSDEFLQLCTKSPQVNTKASTANASQNEISDLLKFSDVKSKLTLGASFEETPKNKPFKSPSPTMNILEADLNTEKFNMPLHFGGVWNSTCIGETLKKVVPVKVGANNSLELSFDMDEEESKRLGQKKVSVEGKKEENVFKVPIMPPPAPKPQANEKKNDDFEIFEDQQNDEEDDDLSKSIYHNNKKDLSVFEHEDVDTWEDERMCSFIAAGENRYEYTIVHQNFSDSISFKLRDAIVKSNGNPFAKKIRDLILEQCNFEQYLEDHVNSCTLLKNVPQLRLGRNIQCGNEEYRVTRLLGKGGFGAVFEVRNIRSDEIFAAKQEKPANMWEYFILIELASRLRSKNIMHMSPAYMQVYNAIIANNASVFISEYSPFGSIIDVCNKIKTVTGRNVDEYIGMIFASQLLSIIDYLHSCHIIHADIKPDNFLLMSKIEIGMKVPALHLIDFGSAIDMESFDNNDQFTYVVNTENFTCCEMLEKKPWTYQTDLFGLCGTVHVILFGKYMEVEKKLAVWQIKTRFPRYFQKDIWDIFFNTLLNVPDCKTIPNLQTLKQQLDEEIAYRQKYILDKVREFNSALVRP